MNDVLKHDLVERQVGHETLQLGVLVPELLQLPGLGRLHAAVDLLPPVVALLRDPVLAAQLSNRRAELRLLQNPGDLFDRKTLPLHGKTLVLTDSILP